MKFDERITPRHLFLFVFISRSVLPVSTLLVVTGTYARQDAWLSALLATVAGPILVWFVMTLAIRHPDETVVEYAPRLLGPVLGYAVVFIFLWLYLHHASIILRIYGEALAAAVIPETPIVFVMGVMIFLAALGARYGIEVLGRMADLLVPFFVLSTLSVLLLSTSLMDLNWLKPVLAEGTARVVIGAVPATAWFVELIYLLVIVPHVTDVKRARRAATWGAAVAGVLVVAMTLSVLMAFGPDEAVRQAFPAYAMTRLISIGQFLERLEVIPLVAWSIVLYLNLSLLYYAGAKGVSQVLGVSRYRPFVFPMGAVLLSLALLLFDDVPQFREFGKPENFGVYMLAFIFPWVLVLLAASLVRRPRVGENERSRKGGRAS